ncbi:MAG: ABC transporter ATP-binding protein [candidate division Zixibacteria bacterium]|nr:ABC transporter ATP-binding protein [candidate division Zixibacteria bacterium]
MLVSVRELTFGWQDEPLFEGVHCELQEGAVVVLDGENGCGKTTLLQLIAGVVPHFSRGKRLEGHIIVNGRSVFDNPPRDFFPYTGFVPGRNIDFFLLNGNLDEEAALIQSVVGLKASDIERKKGELGEIFSDLHELWSTSFGDMAFYQKVLSLFTIYYLQGARLFLLDEVLGAVPDGQLSVWMELFQRLCRQQKGIVLTAHQLNEHAFPVWKIKDRKLLVS